MHLFRYCADQIFPVSGAEAGKTGAWTRITTKRGNALCKRRAAHAQRRRSRCVPYLPVQEQKEHSGVGGKAFLQQE